jgi:hypothetical protein
MMELLLETLRIERQQTPAKTILTRLLDLEETFAEMKYEIYSLYVRCCETLAASAPTDGGSAPLAGPEVVQRIFAITFASLQCPDRAARALWLLKDAIDNIAFSVRVTKDLVYQAMSPYIDSIFAMYDAPSSPEVLEALLNFVSAVCTTFLTQIADRMSEFINRLFAPLAAVLPRVNDAQPLEHFATLSFLNILSQLVCLRIAGADQQTVNIAQFLLSYEEPLLHGQSIEVVRLTLSIIKTLVNDRWHFLTAEMQLNTLRILFFDGIQMGDPDSVKISIEAIMTAQKFHFVLDLVSLDFRFHAFSSICRELCQCSNSMMRDTWIEFAVFFCEYAPDFYPSLLVPFIQHLPVSPSDRRSLFALFDRFDSSNEFKKVFVGFCDDVAYLLTQRR